MVKRQLTTFSMNSGTFASFLLQESLNLHIKKIIHENSRNTNQQG